VSGRRGLLAAVLVLAAVVIVSYAAVRLWMKSSDLLEPAVVLRGADAGALVEPSLADRIAALAGGARARPDQRQRLIALTFDDGPYPVTTPLLLQTLHDLRVPATFFVIGRDAEQFPALARAMSAAGDEIANHTLTHPNLDELSADGVTAELRGGAAMLTRIAPDPAETRFFRPPHGRYTADTVRAAQAAGYDTILWTDDPGDWRAVAPDALQAHVLGHATAPEILLLHSGRPATIAMLPAVVGRFRAAGYRFVTVSELLRRTSAADLNRPAKISLESGT
jgi:peptidoglycan/xylan/chitin deacetylase (PgdA/CDA1 family)